MILNTTTSIPLSSVLSVAMKSPGSSNGDGKDYLEEESWQKMGTKTSMVSEFMEKLNRRMSGSIFHLDEDRIRVLWLSTTLFFTVGGYWLLRSLKDPIISIIDGVRPLFCLHSCTVYVILVLCSNDVLYVITGG